MLLPRGKEGECEHSRLQLRMSYTLVLCVCSPEPTTRPRTPGIRPREVQLPTGRGEWPHTVGWASVTPTSGA